MTIHTRCISHLGITVSDLTVSVGFYTDVLGFSVRYENVEDGWKRVGLALGDIIVELFSPFPSPGSAWRSDPFYPTEYGRPKLAITVADVDVAYQQLSAAGVAPQCPVTSTSASKFFFIADPDGTPVQLQEFRGGGARLAEMFADP